MRTPQTQHLVQQDMCPAHSHPGVARPMTCYFMYDNYYDWQDFQANNPGAVPIATGVLEGWQWHINITGRPNVRKASQSHGTHKAGLMPAPFIKDRIYTAFDPATWGFVFVISEELEHELDKKHGDTHIKRKEQIICRNYPDPVNYPIEAIFYFDLRNSSDFHPTNMLRDPRESPKWWRGMLLMQIAGAPTWWLSMVTECLMGKIGWSEPIVHSNSHLPRYMHNMPAGTINPQQLLLRPEVFEAPEESEESFNFEDPKDPLEYHVSQTPQEPKISQELENIRTSANVEQVKPRDSDKPSRANKPVKQPLGAEGSKDASKVQRVSQGRIQKPHTPQPSPLHPQSSSQSTKPQRPARKPSSNRLRQVSPPVCQKLYRASDLPIQSPSAQASKQQQNTQHTQLPSQNTQYQPQQVHSQSAQLPSVNPQFQQSQGYPQHAQTHSSPQQFTEQPQITSQLVPQVEYSSSQLPSYTSSPRPQPSASHGMGPCGAPSKTMTINGALQLMNSPHRLPQSPGMGYGIPPRTTMVNGASQPTPSQLSPHRGITAGSPPRTMMVKGPVKLPSAPNRLHQSPGIARGMASGSPPNATIGIAPSQQPSTPTNPPRLAGMPSSSLPKTMLVRGPSQPPPSPTNSIKKVAMANNRRMSASETDKQQQMQ